MAEKWIFGLRNRHMKLCDAAEKWPYYVFIYRRREHKTSNISALLGINIIWALTGYNAVNGFTSEGESKHAMTGDGWPLQLLNIGNHPLFSIDRGIKDFTCLGQPTPVGCCWTGKYVPAPLGKLLNVVFLFSRALSTVNPTWPALGSLWQTITC